MVQQWDLVRTIGISGWVICATLSYQAGTLTQAVLTCHQMIKLRIGD